MSLSIGALAVIPLFRNLDDAELALLADHLQKEFYPKGSIIFCQGDMGDAMYLIASGKVDVVVYRDVEEVIACLGPGSFVGEISLLVAQPRAASLKVTIDAEVWVLYKHDFEKLIRTLPPIAKKIIRNLSQRLVTTTRDRQALNQQRITALLFGEHIFLELCKNLYLYLGQSVGLLLLPGTKVKENTILEPYIVLLTIDHLTKASLTKSLSHQVEFFKHVVILMPYQPNPLAREALGLADTVVSIGPPPHWVADNVPTEKIWETTNDPKQLSRIARRLTGHTVGLALSSGGGKGLAHLGVMKVLQEANIPIDFIAGTSTGAFFGILYAMGWNGERFNDFADEIQTFTHWINWDINFLPRAGMLKGAKARDIIARVVEYKRFEDLDIPFYCVAADIMTGEEVVFDSGDLADAIRASLSIPGLVDPWQIGERYFIDGTFVTPIPAKVLRDRGADIVIASSVIRPLADFGREASHIGLTSKPHFLKIISNIQNMIEVQILNTQLEAIDVLINTKVQINHAVDFSKARNIIDAGEEAARTQLFAIKQYFRQFFG